jgi:hypothetical protein
MARARRPLSLTRLPARHALVIRQPAVQVLAEPAGADPVHGPYLGQTRRDSPVDEHIELVPGLFAPQAAQVDLVAHARGRAAVAPAAPERPCRLGGGRRRLVILCRQGLDTLAADGQPQAGGLGHHALAPDLHHPAGQPQIRDPDALARLHRGRRARGLRGRQAIGQLLQLAVRATNDVRPGGSAADFPHRPLQQTTSLLQQPLAFAPHLLAGLLPFTCALGQPRGQFLLQPGDGERASAGRSRGLGQFAVAAVQCRQQPLDLESLLADQAARPCEQVSGHAHPRGDGEGMAGAGPSELEREQGAEGLLVEGHGRVDHGGMVRRGRLEEAVVCRGDHAATPADECLQEGKRQGGALLRIRAGADLVAEHERVLVGDGQELGQVAQMGREAAQGAGDRLLIPEVHAEPPDQGQGRVLARRHVPAALGQQQADADRLERHGLAAGVRSADEHDWTLGGRGQIQRHDRLAGPGRAAPVRCRCGPRVHRRTRLRDTLRQQRMARLDQPQRPLRR